MTTPATLYCRFSPRPIKAGDAERMAMDLDLASMQVQIDTNSRLCAYQQIPVGAILKEPFTSAYSTNLFDRPEGSKLKDLSRGSVVVAMDMTRLFRDTCDGLTTIRHFNKRGVKLLLSNWGGNAIDVSTPLGFRFAAYELVNAEIEPMMTAERTSRGMLHRQANGELMTHPKTVRYGSRLDEATGIVIADGNECDAMRLAISLKTRNVKHKQIGREILPLIQRWNGKLPSRQTVDSFINDAPKNLKAAEALGA